MTVINISFWQIGPYFYSENQCNAMQADYSCDCLWVFIETFHYTIIVLVAPGAGDCCLSYLCFFLDNQKIFIVTVRHDKWDVTRGPDTVTPGLLIISVINSIVFSTTVPRHKKTPVQGINNHHLSVISNQRPVRWLRLYRLLSSWLIFCKNKIIFPAIFRPRVVRVRSAAVLRRSRTGTQRRPKWRGSAPGRTSRTRPRTSRSSRQTLNGRSDLPLGPRKARRGKMYICKSLN